MSLKIKRKFKLAICELFHPVLHGYDDNETIYNNYLIHTTFKSNAFYNNNYKNLERYLQGSRNRENQVMRLNEIHPTLRNYNQKYIRLEIIEMGICQTDSEYHVAYLKTFWLRIVQRCWKKVFKARKELIKKRSNIKAIKERERTGLWPVKLRQWPLFKVY
jgi:hypothetical protein